jgi:transposase
MSAPDSLPTNATALQALLLAERTRHAEELAAARGEADRAQGEIARLMAIIKARHRHRFGRRSERLDADQLALALEDLEQMLAAAQAAAEKDDKASVKPAVARKRQINRGALPPHLPREEIVIDVADRICACCGGLMQACSSAQSPISAMNPVCSAIGMNTAGEIIPLTGCSQRMGASRRRG